MKKIILLGLLTVLCSLFLNAQRGKDGSKTVTGTEVVNAYTELGWNTGAGSTGISVVSSNLSSNFSNNLGAGDLLMIIQVQGAQIINSNPLNSSDWGQVEYYQRTGNYEFVQVKNVPNSTNINLDCPLQKDYSSNFSGSLVYKTMVIRVPRYTDLTINSGGKVTADIWNGSTGGIVAIEVDGITTINSGGSIDVSEIGFRGGQPESNSFGGGSRFADNNSGEGAEKGEGIAGDQVYYSASLAGRYCKGAPANAGGGGTSVSAGGGGGGNAGNTSNWQNGVGIPDPTFNAAWISESPSIAMINASGGGRGGYTHSSTNEDALEFGMGPGNTDWDGDWRRNNGGLGGRPLDYSTGKIFMGGAGGAGDGNQVPVTAGAGGNGAGIIFISSYGDISGSGSILANGQDGFNAGTTAPAPFNTVTGTDGAGGAGAGGTVIIKSTGTVSSISINANGGNGGDQILKAGAFASVSEAEGPGGGGGGGYIAISSGTPTRNTNGGTNGTTDSPHLTEFPPNGATSGGIGLPTESIDAFDITVNNESICTNTTATLTAGFTGIAPSGTTFEWYDAPTGGNLLFTGNPYITASLAATDTFYVQACPAPYRIASVVTVAPCGQPVASFTLSNDTVCLGQSITFTDNSTGSNINDWDWTFTNGTPNSANTQGPHTITFNTIGLQNINLSITDDNGTDDTTFTIMVNTLPTVVASVDTAICSGDQVNLSATGADSYSWDNSLGAGQNQTPSPTSLTTYNVTGTDLNGCSNTDAVIVSINAIPTVVASVDTAICSGDQANLSATGADSYSWDNSLGAGQNQTPSPTTLTTYNVTGTDLNGCSNTDAVIVSINAIPTVVASVDTAICSGDQVNLSASGADSYSWDNSLGAGQTQTPSPTTLTTYNVTGTDLNGCSNTDAVIVSINALPTVIANATINAICSGDTVSVYGTGANTYSWNNSVTNGTVFNPTNTMFYSVIGTDGNGCIGTDSVQITVNNCTQPTASFTLSNDTICVNDSITFTDNSTGINVNAWNWTFQNGTLNNASSQGPHTITFNNSGLQDITLSITDDNGTDDTTFTVMINILPIVIASVDTAICIGDQVNISATGADSYSWDNSLGAGQTQTPSPTTLTTYNVTGTDLNGCINTDNVIVSINALPTVIANATVSAICSGDTVSVYGTGANSYIWNNSVTNGTVFNPINTMYYTVIGTDVNGCLGSDSVQVNVNNCTEPTASFTTSSNSICVGDSITFTDNSTGLNVNAWNWIFQNGTPNNANTQGSHTIQFNTAGMQNVTLSVTDDNGTDDTTIVITVNVLPNVVASVDTAICIGDQVNLSATGADSYSWDNSLGAGQTQTPSPTTLTTYNVTGTDLNGCSNTDAVIVNINNCNPPIALFSTTNTTTCIDECISFSYNETGGTPDTWSWYFFGANSSTSNSQNPNSICYDSTGTFDVALVTSNAFGSDSLFIANYITVDSCNIIPTKVIIPNVFTPNGDNNNDLFTVSGTGIISATIGIYNRWGSLLFNTDNLINVGWDGRTSSGSECADGTYFYIIDVETTEETKTYKGTVTLVR
ncbi:PKD domain-containing protein [Vicingaceae bacterium]|nr:PKD domain-containing protein [Vicingaceae bacterium]